MTRHGELGAWIGSLFLYYVRHSERLIGHPGDFEIFVRPGNPGTIDIHEKNADTFHHGVMGIEDVAD